jgi:hypothetical protein
MSRKTRMLGVIREVYDGGRDLIPNWSLLRHAERAARQGGVEGLRRYVADLIRFPDDRAKWVRKTLEAQNRKTLESEYERFLAAYRSSLLMRLRSRLKRTPRAAA